MITFSQSFFTLETMRPTEAIEGDHGHRYRRELETEVTRRDGDAKDGVSTQGRDHKAGQLEEGHQRH